MICSRDKSGRQFEFDSAATQGNNFRLTVNQQSEELDKRVPEQSGNVCHVRGASPNIR
jgi:hypothetical protein